MAKRYPTLAWYRLRTLDRRELVHFSIALGILVVGLVLHFLEHFRYTLLLVLALVAVETVLLWKEYLALAEPRDSHLRSVSAFPDLLPILKSAHPPDGYVVTEPVPGEAVLRSDGFDRWLIEESPVIPLRIRKMGLDRRILKANEPYMDAAFETLAVRLHGSGTRLFNAPKVSLQSELAEGVREARVGKTGYITGALTNDACVMRLERTIGQASFVQADLTLMYPIEARNGSVRLLGLDESLLSNHIGVSTLGLFRSEDGACTLVLPRQNRKAQRSAGKLVPSGSGSLDWNDVDRLDRKDLLSLVIRGAEREMTEELGLAKIPGFPHSGVRFRTKPIGCVRWLNVGGKPEFLCLSTVELSSLGQLSPQKSEIAQGPSDLWQRSIRIRSLKELGEISEERDLSENEMSLPLAAGLDRLSSILGGRLGNRARSEIERFLGETLDLADG